MRARLVLVACLCVIAIVATRPTDDEAPASIPRAEIRRTATTVTSHARALAAPAPALARVLDPSRVVTADDTEGFLVEDGELVSAGERLRRRNVGPALVVHPPEDVRGAFDVVPDDVAAKRVRITLAEAKRARRELVGGNVVYRDAARSTDVIVRAGETSMQALYLLRDADAPTTFSWRVELGAELEEDVALHGDGLVVRAAGGEIALRMPYGVAFDANGEPIAVRPRYDAARATVTWSLERAPTAYPVLVDPVIEAPMWEPRAPFARKWHAMAYDTARQKTFLVGGVSSGRSSLEDVWSWDGRAWTIEESAESFGPYLCSMAYDALRDDVVLFSGASTTLWDGASWRSDAGVQPRMSWHAMAYDSARDVVVLFGGDATATETWVWNGAWTNALASGPSAGSNLTMAYDAAREEMVLFDGERRQTWIFDGASWTQRMSVESPTRGARVSMAYDAARQEIVLFGGALLGGRGEMWIWDGASWAERGTSGRVPRPRDAPEMVYDVARGEVLLFGGGNDEELGDLWAWNGASWRPLEPTPRDEHAMAYDDARGETVLFGGVANGVALGETWVWKDHAWTERIVPTSPSPRFGLALAYDEIRGEVVLFGGTDGTSTLGDTWTWDGTTWTESQQSSSPSARHGHAMAYDGARGETVLFGGSTTHTPTYQSVQRDTWLFRDGAWTQANVQSSPPERYRHAMAYDAVHGDVVVLAGADKFGTRDEMSVWDGSAWTTLYGAQPEGRVDHALAYASFGGELYLFGGEHLFGLSDETWIRTSRNNWSTQYDWLVPRHPERRVGHAMVYDSAHNELVVFGGTTDRADAPTMVRHTAYRLGHRCTDAEECTTGFCVDGVCCDSACAGGVDDCLTCGGSGRCRPTQVVCRPAVDLCDVAERCDGPGTECPPDAYAAEGATCRGVANACDVAELCNGIDTTCPEDAARAEGSMCQGASAGACDLPDLCEGTVGASATCVVHDAEAGTPCRAASCQYGIRTHAAVCTGTGSTCPFVTTSCGDYACGDTECLTTCADDDACGVSAYCEAGACMPKAALGVACDEARECVNGRCVDGVCCNVACEGACEACAEPGREGSCVIVVGAPRGDREACTGAGTPCGGTCNGYRRTTCVYPQSNATCQAAACLDGVVTGRSTCDGAGACAAPTVTVCQNGACNVTDTDCLGACADTPDCASSEFCVAGVCVPDLPIGAPCDEDAQCVNDACNAGLCCATHGCLGDDAGTPRDAAVDGGDDHVRGGCSTSPSSSASTLWTMLFFASTVLARRRRPKVMKTER